MHRPSITALSLAHWTTKAINQECGMAYHVYEKKRRQQYVDYFAQHTKLRCPRQAHSAKNLRAALPPGRGDIQTLIPQNAWHVHARSGKSSQTLALALLGNAARLDPSLSWFWRAFDLPAPLGHQHPSFAFERSLSTFDLNEKPRATVLDFAVDGPNIFVAVETKWTEAGLGTCSCSQGGADSPDIGGYCSERVLSRKCYWQAAEQFFGLPAERLPLFGCPISPAYQAIRNVAAAQKLAAGKRPFGFILIYDQENPYFHTTGKWPGWPAILRAHLVGHERDGFYFRAISWQDLLIHLPLDERVRRWAMEKHQIGR